MYKYKVIAQGFSYIKHGKIIDLILEKQFFFLRKSIPQTHKVYFDLYDKKINEKIHIWGSANIEKSWVDLWYKKRNQVRDVLEKHFKTEFDIGNYRSNYEK